MRRRFSKSGRLNLRSPAEFNADVLRVLARSYGFLSNVRLSFDGMTRHAEQLQIRFPVFAAVDERDGVVISRTQFSGNLQSTNGAPSTKCIKYPDFDTRRDCLIIGGSNPLW